jgi:glycosyltransferase involved in cell wall biosynthesis
MKTWVVIPAYNEGQNASGNAAALVKSLDQLIKELKRKGLSTLVIDDGSVDNTFDIVKDDADVVIQNDKNLGKGMALKKAIDYLLKEDKFDYIITMDADGQHCPSDIENFIKETEKGEYFVVGNRMDNPLGMPGVRAFTNKFMSWLISRIVRQIIPDTQCGFRLIKRDVLEKIKITTSNFEIESEILIKAAWGGFPVKSIPIKSIYFKNKKSKISPFVDTVRFVRFILLLSSEHKGMKNN